MLEAGPDLAHSFTPALINSLPDAGPGSTSSPRPHLPWGLTSAGLSTCAATRAVTGRGRGRRRWGPRVAGASLVLPRPRLHSPFVQISPPLSFLTLPFLLFV